MQNGSSQVLNGTLMVVGSMAVIGLIDNFIRYIVEEANLWQFYLVRAIFACGILGIYFLWRKQEIRPKRAWAVALRSLLLAGAIFIYFGSITVMPIAEAGATLFSSPIFVLVFSFFLFGTKVGYWRIGAVVIGFMGVLLVLKPDLINLGLFTLLPLMAGILYALGQLITRHFCADENTSVVLLGFFVATGLLGAVGLLVFSIFEVPDRWSDTAAHLTGGWVEPTGRFMFWTFIQCIGSLVAVTGLIRGYQIAEPTYLAVFEYSFLIFAGFWAWMLWNEIPDAIAFIGIAMIVSAGIVITLRSKSAA